MATLAATGCGRDDEGLMPLASAAARQVDRLPHCISRMLSPLVVDSGVIFSSERNFGFIFWGRNLSGALILVILVYIITSNFTLQIS